MSGGKIRSTVKRSRTIAPRVAPATRKGELAKSLTLPLREGRKIFELSEAKRGDFSGWGTRESKSDIRRAPPRNLLDNFSKSCTALRSQIPTLPQGEGCVLLHRHAAHFSTRVHARRIHILHDTGRKDIGARCRRA